MTERWIWPDMWWQLLRETADSWCYRLILGGTKKKYLGSLLSPDYTHCGHFIGHTCTVCWSSMQQFCLKFYLLRIHNVPFLVNTLERYNEITVWVLHFVKAKPAVWFVPLCHRLKWILAERGAVSSKWETKRRKNAEGVWSPSVGSVQTHPSAWNLDMGTCRCVKVR